MAEDSPPPPLSPLPEKPLPLPTAWKVVLAVVLLASVAFGLAHLKLAPLAPNSQVNYINAPDEAAHYLYVRCLAEAHRIPVRGDAEYPTYEWHQPPLYYALAAPLYGLGPIAERALSILLGLLSVLCIFTAVRWLFPRDPAVSVVAAGFAALLPMRQAVYASAGNDSLIELMFSVTLLIIIRIHQRGFTTRRAALLGAALAAAMLTKATGILLIPVAVMAIAMLGRSGEARPMILRGAAVSLLVVVILTSPWYIRNLKLYGELTPAKAFIHEFEGTAKASDFIGKPGYVPDILSGKMEPREVVCRTDYLQWVVGWTFRTFWASYTKTGQPALAGVPTMLPNGLYACGLIIILVGLVGLLRSIFNRHAPIRLPSTILILFVTTAALVKLAFLAFTWTFFQTQGRYVYPAMLPIAILMAVGICSVTPERYRTACAVGTLGLMGMMSLAFLLVGIVPAYTQ